MRNNTTEAEWLRGKVVYYETSVNPSEEYAGGDKLPIFEKECGVEAIGWLYKEEYENFVRIYGVNPTYTWKPIPDGLVITKDITQQYNQRHDRI